MVNLIEDVKEFGARASSTMLSQTDGTKDYSMREHSVRIISRM